MKTQLTALEKIALPQLFESSAGNGHDFGFTDEVCLPNKRSLGGVIASLSKKGLITVYEPHCVNMSDWVVQFKFEDIDQAEQLVAEIKAEKKKVQ